MTVMSDNRKAGRIIGTGAAIVLVVSVLAIIYMAMRPNVPVHSDSFVYLLAPPGSQNQSQ
jgi:hypothetical protein